MSEYSAEKLQKDYLNSPSPLKKTCRPLSFGLLQEDKEDIYNPSSPFWLNSEKLLAARQEPRDNHNSRIRLFREEGGIWSFHPSWDPIAGEDPFFVSLRGTPLLGMVETSPSPEETGLIWQTVLYDISRLSRPEKVFTGPQGMKDLRFLPLEDGKIAFFTRPQGGKAKRGTCGYGETESLDRLTPGDLLGARLISHPDGDSWEGINQPFLLNEGTIGLLGHTAWMEKDSIRHYSVCTALFDRKTVKKTPWKIILTRNALPPGPAKRSDLRDVLFPGGMTREDNGSSVLYLGVSDVRAWAVEISAGNLFT